MTLQTLDAAATATDILEAMERDGAAIIRDAIDPNALRRLVAEVTPYVQTTPMGRDDFTGRRTQRTGALVARSPSCRALIMHPARARMLPAAFWRRSPTGSSCT